MNKKLIEAIKSDRQIKGLEKILKNLIELSSVEVILKEGSVEAVSEFNKEIKEVRELIEGRVKNITNYYDKIYPTGSLQRRGT